MRSQRAAALREQAASPVITRPEKEATTSVATSSLTHQFSTSLNKKIHVSTKIITIAPRCDIRMTHHPDHQHKLETRELVTPDDGYHSASSQAHSTHGDEEEESVQELKEQIMESMKPQERLDAERMAFQGFQQSHAEMNKTEEDDQQMSENDEPGRTVLEERKALSLRGSDKRIKEESMPRKDLKRMEWDRNLARENVKTLIEERRQLSALLEEEKALRMKETTRILSSKKQEIENIREEHAQEMSIAEQACETVLKKKVDQARS